MRDAQTLADAILENGRVVIDQRRPLLRARWGRLKFWRTLHPLASRVSWIDRHTRRAAIVGQFFDYAHGFRELVIWHQATPIERDPLTVEFRRPSWAS